MSNSATKAAGSFPLLGIMFLIFLTLKLCGVISWSWWWITAPLWGPFVLIFALFLLIFPFVLISKKR